MRDTRTFKQVDDNEMAILETIEREIKQLSKVELIEFRQWFAEFDASLWDAQIRSDAVARKLNRFSQ